MIHNNITVFTKVEMTQKLSDRGIFVDIATLESFLRKWSIEAIFENEKGEDLYDKNSFETLYINIKNKNQPQKPQCEDIKEDAPKTVEENLNEIKWHAWQEVSGDLCKTTPKKPLENRPVDISPLASQSEISNITGEILPEKELTQVACEEIPNKIELPQEISLPDQLNNQLSPQLQTLLSNGLRNDNVFKLDISDDTLDLIARTIAKKIVKHVNAELSPETDTQLMLIEAKNENLQKELEQTKEANEKLQEELEEKRENLGRFQKTIFGFYRFVRDRGKRK